MNTYLVSYITNSGVTVLNTEASAVTPYDVISDIKGSEGIRMVLSCIKIN